ncbi:MAG: 50S ribosomal protein L21 [Gammaproteobacteria bacterium]|nr:50S ribosomal protein L21 [Gammaproteobacteria bacterium]
MYAVIASGGKQYKVSEGEVLKLEKLTEVLGAEVNFDQVLMVADGENVKIGTPYVKGATVSGEIVEHGRGEKIDIIKFRRRKHFLKHTGHRQDFTAVKIKAIKH